MIKHVESIQLAAAARNETGSGPVKRLRQQGWLPCVVYDAKGQALALKINRHNFEMLLRQHGARNLILELDIEAGQRRLVLLKEVQRDYVRDYLLHADFLEISMTQKLRVEVALHLVGEPIGVTQQGGVLEHILRVVEVECLPSDIVKSFSLDVSQLDIGDSLFVRDLNIASQFTLLTSGDIAVASVQLPDVEEETKPEAEAAEATGPEVIGKGKDEDTEAGEAQEADEKGKPDTKENADKAAGKDKPGTKETKEKAKKA